jgi:DNA-binding PadR family transcriptional regulator
MRRLIAPGKVAEYLAVAGRTHPYAIAKGTGLSTGRVGDALPRLKELGLVEGKKIGEARTGLPIKGYSLTIKGLAYTLLLQPKLWENIDTIAKKHEKLLPLIFAKWEYFDNAGAKELLVANLKLGIEAVARPMSIMGPSEYAIDEKGTEHLINQFVLWPTAPFSPFIMKQDQRLKWEKVIMNDPDLKRFVIDLIEKEIQRTEWVLGEVKKDFDNFKHRAPRSQGGEGKSKKKGGGLK